MSIMSQEKWLLLNKKDEFRYFKNSFNIYILIITALFPIAIIIDAIFNRLWRQLIYFALAFFIFVIILSALQTLVYEYGDPSYGSPRFLYFIALPISLYWYHSGRVKWCYLKLSREGWKQISSSSERSLKKAIAQWESEGFIVNNN